METPRKDSSFQKSESRARKRVAEGGGEDLELQGDPESSQPGLLKGKRQTSKGNQSWWVDHQVASWGAGPPHGINRAASVPGQAACWAGTPGCCSRNKGSSAGASFARGQTTGQGPQNAQSSGKACTGRRSDGLQTSHAFILRVHRHPSPN